MKHYAGLDVSMKETFVCIIDENGKRVAERSLETDPKILSDFILGFEFDIELAGLESGSLSHWLTAELLELGVPVKCIDARHVAAILSVNVNKTDKNDARGIADAMRCNLFKEVAIKPKNMQAISTLLNSRRILVDQRVQVIGSIRGMLKVYGIRLLSIGNRKASIERIRFHFSEIPEEAQFGIQQLLQVLEALIDAIDKCDKRIRVIISTNELAQLLMTSPGIGPITALRYLAEIGDPSRFHNSKSVGGYVGLSPRQYSSGETERYGGVSKCGPKELRRLLVEAALVLLTRSQSWSKLKAWGFRLQKRHGLKKAATAVARKLAVILHRMLITGETFRFTDKKEAA